MSSVETALQFLAEGDLLGFLQALYVTAFTSADVFYGFLTMLFLGAIYIRTHSLALLCILWILVGSVFMVAMPLVAGLGMILLILGIGGMLYQLFRARSSQY